MSAGPRDFYPITGLEHLGVVFQGRIYEVPEEINETHQLISDPRFPNAGCRFFAYVLTAADTACLKPVALPEAKKAPEITTANPATTEGFYFEGRQIFKDGERVAGLFGDDAHLRVRSEHSDIRPAIEAWLNSQPTT